MTMVFLWVMPSTWRSLSLVALEFMAVLAAIKAPRVRSFSIIGGGATRTVPGWTPPRVATQGTALSSSFYNLYQSTSVARRRRATVSSSGMSDGHYPQNKKKEKTITFVRHGCTYMNEYLGGADGGRSFGSPHFSDIFDHDRRTQKYQDSPLSPLGLRQAQAMAQKRTHDFVTDCELVVTSPLTRALQTFDVGLRSHFVATSNDKKNDGDIPVIALPEAAERLYLISDVGRSVDELQKLYSYVDFETGFVGPDRQQQHDRDQWWYHPSKNRRNPSYAEWRPVGRGQRYACPGEPLPEFHHRMGRLHAWLDARPEQHIALVCHHGVIQSFLDCDFDNCQYRSVLLEEIQPHFEIQKDER